MSWIFSLSCFSQGRRKKPSTARTLLNIHTDLLPENPHLDRCLLCANLHRNSYIKTPCCSAEKWSPVRDRSEAFTQHCPPSLELPSFPLLPQIFFISASFHHPSPLLYRLSQLLSFMNPLSLPQKKSHLNEGKKTPTNQKNQTETETDVIIALLLCMSLSSCCLFRLVSLGQGLFTVLCANTTQPQS